MATRTYHPEPASFAAQSRRYKTGYQIGAATELIICISLLITLATAFLISTYLGLALGFVAMLGIAIFLPASTPTIIIGGFLLQNTIIASFSPLVESASEFDSVRAVNFVLLVTTFGAFLLASFLTPQRLPIPVRNWLLASLGLLAIILFYLCLGAVRGEARDAIVYFRNTVTPIACLYIGLTAASQYRVQVNKAITAFAAIAIAFGYCELVFTFDFLSLFNGDRYIELNMRQQIDTGYWEKTLQETGFVLRDLSDAMRTSFFNTNVFGDIFPKVFRIGGPNFHPISFAYALSIFAAWLLFNRHGLIALAALPLLLVVGSKGAMILFLMAVAVRVGLRFLTPQAVSILFLLALGLWVSATLIIGITGADYHALGLLAGLRDFLKNPIGQGLGIGGILSSSVETKLDWGLAQQSGATDIPVESAVGVMLYQMGIFAFAFIGLMVALAHRCHQLFLRTGIGGFMFGFVAILTLCANALLQEEAFYSPLALGLCLLLTGISLGTYWRTNPGKG